MIENQHLAFQKLVKLYERRPVKVIEYLFKIKLNEDQRNFLKWDFIEGFDGRQQGKTTILILKSICECLFKENIKIYYLTNNTLTSKAYRRMLEHFLQNAVDFIKGISSGITYNPSGRVCFQSGSELIFTSRNIKGFRPKSNEYIVDDRWHNEND